MKLRNSFLALLLLTAFGLVARANPVDFKYEWFVNPTDPITNSGGFGQVSLSAAGPGEDSATVGAPNGAFIQGATLSAVSGSDSLESFDAPFDLTMKVTDKATNESYDFVFTGRIAGEMSKTSSTIKSTFDQPGMETFKLGDYLYTVKFAALVAGPVLPPGALPPNTPVTPVALTAEVTVANVPDVTNTPEPSSLVLGATALLGFAARRYVRRRRKG